MYGIGSSWTNKRGDTVIQTATGLKVVRNGSRCPVRPTASSKPATAGSAIREVKDMVAALSARIDAWARRRGIILDPRAGDTVPAWQIANAYLTPGGELLGELHVEHAASQPQFMPPITDEQSQLRTEAQGLRTLIDRPATDEFTRADARIKLERIEQRLEEIRRRAQPETDVDRSGRRRGS